MSLQYDIRVDLTSGDSVISVDDLRLAGLPPFVEGISLDLRIWGIQKILGIASYLPVSGVSLFVSLGNLVPDTPIYYTQQATWTPSSDLAQPYFEATLPMNVAFPFAGKRSIKADFGIIFSTGGGQAGALIKSVTVKKSTYSSSSIIVPAGQTPLSLEMANALFLQRTIKGRVTFVNDTDSTKRRDLFTDTDGSFHEDPS